MYFQQSSGIPILGSPILHSEKLQDVCLSVAYDLLFISLFFFLIRIQRDHAMVRQLVPFFMSHNPQCPVEHIASSEVQQSVCEFLGRIVFDIEAAMEPTVKLADTHVGKAFMFLVVARKGKMVCD